MILNLDQLVAAVMFTGVRISGLMLVAPFFGSVSLPPRIRVAFAMLLIWVIAPLRMSQPLPANAIAWVAVAGSELMIGLLLGLCVQFVMEAAQLAGQILGVQMGYSLVHVLDPQTQADTPVLGLLHQTLALLLFLALDAHHWLLRGVVRSFAYIPSGAFRLTGEHMQQLFHLAGGLWLAGVQIAAPALVVTMLADVAAGFLGKISPHMPVLFLSLPVKSMLGLAVMAGAVVGWPAWFGSAFEGAITTGERLLHLPH